MREADVLDGEALMRLYDARIQKDEKKKEVAQMAKGRHSGKGAGLHVRHGPPSPSTKRKPPPQPSTNVPLRATPLYRGLRANFITITATPYLLVIDSEDIFSEESEPKEIRDIKWASITILPLLTNALHLPSLSPSSQLFPPPALSMNLQERKFPTT